MGYIFDFAACFALLGVAIIGFKRGFILELFDVLAMAIGFCIARVMHATGFRLIEYALGNKHLGAGLSFLAEFLLGFIGTRIIGLLIHRKIKRSQLKGINRYGGSILALMKAYIVIGGIVLILWQYPVLGRDWMETSITFPLFRFGGLLVKVLLPNQIAETIGASI